MGRRGARGARPDPPRPPLTPHAAEEFETTVVEEQEEGAALEDEKMLVGRRVYVRRVRPATPPAGGGGAESSGWGAPGAAASGLGPRGRQSPWAPSGCPRPSLPPSRSNLAWKTSWQVGPGSAAAGGGGRWALGIGGIAHLGCTLPTRSPLAGPEGQVPRVRQRGVLERDQGRDGCVRAATRGRWAPALRVLHTNLCCLLPPPPLLQAGPRAGASWSLRRPRRWGGAEGRAGGGGGAVLGARAASAPTRLPSVMHPRARRQAGRLLPVCALPPLHPRSTSARAPSHPHTPRPPTPQPTPPRRP